MAVIAVFNQKDGVGKTLTRLFVQLLIGAMNWKIPRLDSEVRMRSTSTQILFGGGACGCWAVAMHASK